MEKAMLINIIRLVRAVAFLLAVLFGAQSVRAQTPTADYQFQGTFDRYVTGSERWQFAVE